MKHTIKFIIVLFSLVVTGTTSVWGITEDDIIVNVLPNSSAGTVTVAVSGMEVTITATPATDYFIDAIMLQVYLLHFPFLVAILSLLLSPTDIPVLM